MEVEEAGVGTGEAVREEPLRAAEEEEGAAGGAGEAVREPGRDEEAPVSLRDDMGWRWVGEALADEEGGKVGRGGGGP